MRARPLAARSARGAPIHAVHMAASTRRRNQYIVRTGASAESPRENWHRKCSAACAERGGRIQVDARYKAGSGWILQPPATCFEESPTSDRSGHDFCQLVQFERLTITPVMVFGNAASQGSFRYALSSCSGFKAPERHEEGFRIFFRRFREQRLQTGAYVSGPNLQPERQRSAASVQLAHDLFFHRYISSFL